MKSDYPDCSFSVKAKDTALANEWNFEREREGTRPSPAADMHRFGGRYEADARRQWDDDGSATRTRTTREPSTQDGMHTHEAQDDGT
ncbi:hypothetical protein Trydic_g12701 [Trypoxylus dichotomus]